MSEQTTGLIGYPVKHSLSPRIHTWWRKQHGIEGAYELWETSPETLSERVQKIRDLATLGFNITVPHKQAILPFLDEVDDTAARIGAVNTVTQTNGKLIGTNTDAYGFITNLRENTGTLEGYLEHVVILGAGGAARAAIVALKDAGASRLTIMNRTARTAEALAQEFGCNVAGWAAQNTAPEGATLLVNTTSLGMQGKEPLHIDISTLHERAAVYDIVYAPLETRLLEDAHEHGFVAVDGLGMLLYQAQKAFACWHGVEPVVNNALRAHVLESLA
jgi:shikimate dehydrogenase